MIGKIKEKLWQWWIHWGEPAALLLILAMFIAIGVRGCGALLEESKDHERIRELEKRVFKLENIIDGREK